jgi:ACT domain-containing protein
MIMLADIDACNAPFGDFSDDLKLLGEQSNLVINAMHEDIFNSMHKI